MRESARHFKPTFLFKLGIIIYALWVHKYAWLSIDSNYSSCVWESLYHSNVLILYRLEDCLIPLKVFFSTDVFSVGHLMCKKCVLGTSYKT